MKTSELIKTLQKDFGRIEVATRMMEQLLMAENYAGTTQILPTLQSELKGFSELLSAVQFEASSNEAKEIQQVSEQKPETPVG